MPTEDDEALRDLVRTRQDAKEDELWAKHRLSKFLLRNDIHSFQRKKVDPYIHKLKCPLPSL